MAPSQWLRYSEALFVILTHAPGGFSNTSVQNWSGCSAQGFAGPSPVVGSIQPLPDPESLAALVQHGVLQREQRDALLRWKWEDSGPEWHESIARFNKWSSLIWGSKNEPGLRAVLKDAMDVNTVDGSWDSHVSVSQQTWV